MSEKSVPVEVATQAESEHEVRHEHAPLPADQVDVRQTAGNLAVQRMLRGGGTPRELEGNQPQAPDARQTESPAADQVPASPGQPLDAQTRRHFEGRFGQDLGDVRVYMGGDAGRSAASVGAAAYAIGNRVVFGQGQYAPELQTGRRLIAHELAHVVQQRAGTERDEAPDSPALEQAASRAALGAELGAGPVTVEGRARVGLAPLPRSLSSSLDPDLLSEYELEDEVREIRQWLVDHPQDTTERQRLLSVLPGLEGRLRLLMPAAPVGRDEFAAAFFREFGSVLHAFPELSRPSGPICIDLERPWDLSDEQSMADTLAALFTPTQREKIMDFITTRRIPERLFNGDDIGATSAQQRILLSAHILASGTYQPGSFHQRVHARMCWHWVQIVHHYAGVTPASGGIAQGVMGSFDPLGGVVLGSGQAQSIYQGERVYAEALPSTEIAGGVGPIEAGTAHARAAAAEHERLAEDPSARRTVHRRAALPMGRFGEIRAGDWLWYYNANASAGGSHSVIFSRWVDDTDQTSEAGVPFRRAICFSQSSPRSGGREHTVRLGDQFSRSEDIFPITHVTRVSPDARPAITPLELVPGSSARRAVVLDRQNQQFLRVMERRHGGPVDPARLTGWLHDQNLSCIVELGERLTGRQRKLLQQASESSDIAFLVRLNQRLRALVTNAAILERNMAATFGLQLEERFAQALARRDEERAQAERDIAEIEAELEPIQAAIREREPLESALDLQPQIRGLASQLRDVWRRIQALPRGAERDELQRQRRELRDRIQDLAGKQRAQRGARRALAGELQTLRRQIRIYERRRQQVEARLATGERELPYGLMHPGRLGGQETGRTTGLLRDLDPQPPWSTLIVQPGGGSQ